MIKRASKEENLPNLTIIQTISQSKFWLLWTIFMAISLIQGFVNAYQKSYGMIFIADDFFFTYVGLAANVINGSLRLVWGYLFDLKGFKVRFTTNIWNLFLFRSLLVQCPLDWMFSNISYMDIFIALHNTRCL